MINLGSHKPYTEKDVWSGKKNLQLRYVKQKASDWLMIMFGKWGRGEAGSHNNGIVKLRVRLPSAPLECSVIVN